METAASVSQEVRKKGPMVAGPASHPELEEDESESTGPAPRPCVIRCCTGLASYRSGCPDWLGSFRAGCCPDCWHRTPAAFRRAYHFAQRRVMHSLRAREFVAVILGQALRRLSAERTGESTLPSGGPLGASERQTADALTRRCTAFGSFDDLVGCDCGCVPTLCCHPGVELNTTERDANQQLADYYDREQAARKDPRRATRLGIAGL